MHLNLSDPDSIFVWWRAFPERHWAYLAFFEARSPQFRAAIRAARQRIQADPLFSLDRVHAFDAALQRAMAEAEQAEVEVDAGDEVDVDLPYAAALRPAPHLH